MPAGMSQEEFLARMAAGARNMNNPQDSGMDPEVIKQIIAQKMANQQSGGAVAPPKPDPQAAANAQIMNAAAKQGAPAAAAPGNPSAANGMNPDTGMPYFSPQAPQSPDDQQRQQMNAMKLQALKRMSSGQ